MTKKDAMSIVQKFFLFSLLAFLGSAFVLCLSIPQSSSGLLSITGATSITGAAIADLKAGKFTFISIALLVTILSASFMVFGFFSYIFMCIQNSHVMFDFRSAWRDIFHRK